MSADERFARLSQQDMVVVGASTRTFAGSLVALREIFAHREMLGLLVRRDLKSRYKDSALGFMWSLIRPLTQLLIYYIVIGRFLGAERGIPDFAIYVFIGLTAYGLFSEIVGASTSSIVNNSGLIKKIYLPREVFPLASVGSALFNFGIQMVILLIAAVIANAFPTSVDVLYFIPSTLVLLVYGTAFGILLSAVNVYLRDIQYLVEVLLLIFMWASPIVYSWSMVKDVLGDGLALALYTNNPVTLAILGFQEAFWVAGAEATAAYPPDLLLRQLIALGVGVVLLFGFQRIFARLQGNFAQAL